MIGGFFVFSLKEYATSNILAEDMKAAVRKITRKATEFTLFWSAINCYEISLTGPFVMQVEVDKSNYEAVRSALNHIYNKLKLYPLGIRMVFIPPPGRCLDTELPKRACWAHEAFVKVHRVYDLKQINPRFSLKIALPLLGMLDSNPLNITLPSSEGQEAVDTATSPTTTTGQPNPGLADILVGPKTILEMFQDISVNKIPVFHAVLPGVDSGVPILRLVVVPGPVTVSAGLALAVTFTNLGTLQKPSFTTTW
jgi:hypothetical protein